MITEIPTGALPTDYVDTETGALPDGTPQVEGYYPHLTASGIPEVITWGGVDERGYDQVSTGVLDYCETIDQHPAMYVTATWTPTQDVQRPSGRHDPLTNGPAQPEVIGVNQYYYREAGSSQTHFLDVPGRVFPANGCQDGDSWSYFNDTQLQQIPYNPQLQYFDQESGTYRSGMPDSLRALPPSPVHGWVQQPADSGIDHVWPERQTPGRNEFLALNPFAGQSYSATTAHVPDQSGQVPSMRRRV